MSYSWDWSAVVRNAGPLGAGLWVTLLLTVAAVSLGTAVGLLLFTMRRLAPRPARIVSLVVVDVFRSLPVLVTLIWLFFCLPILSGGVLRPSPFWVATVGLALNFAALYADILRSAYDSIPHGQVEAAYGLQITRTQFLFHIALPEAAWRSLGPALGQIVNTLKLSALASFVAVPEVFFVASDLIKSTARPLEFYTALAGCYLVLIWPLSVGVQSFEGYLARRFQQQ